MLLSKIFKQRISLFLLALGLTIFNISCKLNYQFNGDIRKQLEEDSSTVIYFKKDSTSPVAFTKLYRIGGNYTAADLPNMYSQDVWNMNPGYDLGGWKIETSSISNARNLEIDATGYVSSFYLSSKSITLFGDGYLPSTRTPYTIVLSKEKLNPASPYLYSPKEFDYYTTIDAQGTTNTNTNVLSLLPSIPGFYDPSSGSDYNDDSIDPSGNTVIQVKYRRKDNISISVEDSTLTPAYSKSYSSGVFEAPVAYDPPPTRAGYTISGWKQILGTEETVIANLPATYPAYNYEYNPVWQPILVTYTVKHNRQNTNLSSYGLYEYETKHGYTGSNTEAVAKNYEGFTAQTITQETIAGDGSTEVIVKYDRNAYNLRFNPNDGTGIAGPLQLFTYGVTEALTANTTLGFTRTGYSFRGWATSAARADAGTIDYADGANYTIGASDVELYAVWEANEISITIDVPAGEDVGIEVVTSDTSPGNVTFYARYMNADGTYGDYVSASDGYTFNWFYTDNGIGTPECTDPSWSLTLGPGLYRISLIATKAGVPSGGTVQIRITGD